MKEILWKSLKKRNLGALLIVLSIAVSCRSKLTYTSGGSSPESTVADVSALNPTDTPLVLVQNIERLIVLDYSSVGSTVATSCEVVDFQSLVETVSCTCDEEGVCTVGVTAEKGFIGLTSFTYVFIFGEQKSEKFTFEVAVIEKTSKGTKVGETTIDLVEDVAKVITLMPPSDINFLPNECKVEAVVNVSLSSLCTCDSKGTCRVEIIGDADFYGQGSLSYLLMGNGLFSEKGTAIVLIEPVADAPILGVLDQVSLQEDLEVTITLPYFDADSDLASICLVENLVNLNSIGECSCDATGICQVLVVGTADYSGPASFAYSLTANGLKSNKLTADFAIAPVADPPVALEIGLVNANEYVEKVITLNYIDAESDIATACLVANLVNLTSTLSCDCDNLGICSVGVTGTMNYSGVASFDFMVTAAGQQSNAAGVSLVIDTNDVPVVLTNPICDTVYNQDDPFSCSQQAVQGADADGLGPYVWELDTSNSCDWISIDSSSGVLSGLPDDDDVGVCTVVYYVKDSAINNQSSSISIGPITINNILPTLNITNATPFEENPGVAITIKLDADVQADEEGYGNYTFNHGAIVGSKCFDNSISLSLDSVTGSINYEPSLDYSGTCFIRIKFDDGNPGGTVESEFSLTVTAVNVAPLIDSTCSDKADENNLYQCDLSYSDPDGAGPYIWSIDASNTCAWASVGVGPAITGTPVGTSPCVLSFKVSDGDLDSVVATYNMTVYSDGRTITIPASVSVQEYGVASILVTMSGVRANDTSFDFATADITGISGVDYIGDYVAYTGSAVIPAGETSVYLAPSILSDKKNEPTESFSITISNPGGATILNDTTQIDITDNDYQMLLGASKVRGGNSHTCALMIDGSVMCWGSNQIGQLGNGGATNGSDPVAVIGLSSNAVDLALGYSHACALLDTGNVECWGSNSQGQLGDGTSGINRENPVAVVGLSGSVDKISLGFDYSCALLGDGTVECWGGNNNGQLGDNTSGTSRLNPVVVQGLSTDAIGIGMGKDHSCAVLSDGSIQCWGNNSYAQLGNGTSGGDQLTALAVVGLSAAATAVVGGAFNGCALLNSGSVECWGNNNSGEIGDGTSSGNYSTPEPVVGLSATAVQLSLGDSHSCARLSTGALECWGSNSSGQTNGDLSVVKPSPTNVGGLSGSITDVGVGYNFTCVVITTGAVECWGYNFGNQLGTKYSDKNLTPVSVIEKSTGTSSISTGAKHVCSLSNGGGVDCWGDNSSGQIGDNTTGIDRLKPTGVIGISGTVSQLESGENFNCVSLTVGSVECWGENSNGQLGIGVSGADNLTANPVLGLSNSVESISLGYDHACAVIIGGTVECWGSNSNGQIGDGTFGTDRVNPTAVAGLSGVVISVKLGDSHSCALLAAGGVECWGSNSDGQIGDGSFGTDRLSPVSVLALSEPVAEISLGRFHSCALLASGLIECWGNNAGKELGDGTTTDRYTAVQVTGLSGAMFSLEAGGSHSCAVSVTTRDVECWGRGTFGQIGNGGNSTYSTAQAVLGLGSSVKAISMGGNTSCAVLDSGGVHCWGTNGDGQVGDEFNELFPHPVLKE